MKDYNIHYRYTFRYNKEYISNTCKHSNIKKHNTILKYKNIILSTGDNITYWRMRYSVHTYFTIDLIEQQFHNGVNFGG